MWRLCSNSGAISVISQECTGKCHADSALTLVWKGPRAKPVLAKQCWLRECFPVTLAVPMETPPVIHGVAPWHGLSINMSASPTWCWQEIAMMSVGHQCDVQGAHQSQHPICPNTDAREVLPRWTELWQVQGQEQPMLAGRHHHPAYH